ncbi:glycosyltransferase family 2 protein [Candidatus Nomurabacteria bacterium]|nr:glycosyltransferase family 2 protein [Candidatus Nomurabacteria bacterium]
MTSRISIIIPSYNEGQNVDLLHRRLSAVALLLPEYEFEYIFIDDGSRDDTWGRIKTLGVRGIRFARNFGHQAAIEAGLRAATGEAVIMLDGDLQHPPELIPTLIERWREGYEVVNTKRADAAHAGYIKRLSSHLFYRALNTISEITIEPGSADFRLIDRRVVDELNKLTEKNKFYRGLVNWLGFRSAVVSYEPSERVHGNSSYSFRKMISLARVGLTSFSMTPIRFIAFMGACIFVFGGLLTAFMFLHRLITATDYFGGAAILAGFIIMNNGFLIFIFGLMSTYQVTMYKELQNRPAYIVREEL